LTGKRGIGMNHYSEFEKALITYIGENNLKKIQSVTIGIAGAGGLGSNCALNLVRSGFNKFKIIDYDVVEYSNLNRQFFFLHQVGKAKVDAIRENLLAINPNIQILTVRAKIEKDNIKEYFKDCDVIVEAFDNPVYKKMILEAYLYSDKLLVSVSGLAGWGNSDDIKVHKIKDKFYMVGDLESEVRPNVPPMSPRVNIAAAKQADIILSYVLNNG